MSSTGSSARADFVKRISVSSRRSGSWNSSDANLPSGSSTPRGRTRAPSSSQSPFQSEQSYPSSPPTLSLSIPSSARDSSPTPATPASSTAIFDKENANTFYRYKQEYSAAWDTWIAKCEAYKKWIDDLPREKRNSFRKRGMKWGNNGNRSSVFWEHFQEGASSRGVPLIRCVWCSTAIAHPTKNGTTAMKDHHYSKQCQDTRRRKSQDPRITDALRKQGEKVAGIRRQRDLEIGDVTTQDEWDAQLLRAFLSCGISFNAVSNLHLRATWKMLKKEIQIPCATTLRRRLDTYYDSVRNAIKQRIPKRARISLAIDCWTSPNHLAFLAIVGCFITPDWELKEIMLGFENLPEGHTGKEQAKIVHDCLERYGISDQLGAITSDNASVNESVNAELAKLLSERGDFWDPVQNKIGCLAHTVQLILGVFIDSLKVKATNETVPTALKRGKISKIIGMPPGFKKIIEKIRQIAIAILASPQRNGYFLRLQEGREEIIRGMIRDVSTRWNSTLSMLDRALALKIYIRHWVEKYPAYRGLLLTEDEWILLEDVLSILQPFRFYTLWISSSKTVTIHRSIEVYSSIILRLQKRLHELKHTCLDWKVELRDAIESTLEYATRVWDNLDSVHLDAADRPVYPNSSRAMPLREDTIMDLAAMLDPFTKLTNFEGWDKEDEKAGVSRDVSWTASYRQRFLHYWKQHYAPNLQPPPLQRKRRRAAFDSDEDMDDDINDSARDQEEMIAEMQKLVEQYLDGDTESISPPQYPERVTRLVANKGSCYELVMTDFYFDSSVLRWWASNSDRKELYPLAQMARDILATPAAAVACESAFSSGRDLLHYRRSRMKADTITKSMICKHYDRATMKDDVDEISDDINDSSERKLQALEVLASQFDVIINTERAATKRRRRRHTQQRDLVSHRSLTEGTGMEQGGVLKSLRQIEHDGDVEFNKPLPDLPEKRFTKAQTLLPRATGNEEEEVNELEPFRAASKLPSVTWDALSDFSSSDTEEEDERRRERHHKREKELQNRNTALRKARDIRPVARRGQRKGKEPAARRDEAESGPRSPKSRRLSTPTRSRQGGSVTPDSARPRRVAALRKEGAYKQ